MLKPQRGGFTMLVRSIISQQISTAAARSIRARLESLAGTKRLTPEIIGRLSVAELRSVGVSPQKTGYLLDLAGKTLDGTLRFRNFARKSDEQIIATLTQVKGIGVWTAQMYLIFSAGRLDVFPHDDLGVRVAIKELYGLPALPDKVTGHRIAAPWRPYASVASWYCWRYLDRKRAAPSKP
jgi:DNA-3-methyladenine glycosylase II